MSKRGGKRGLKNKGTHTLTLVITKKICPKSKRSQVTIFIIIGMLIVASIALFLVARSGIIPQLQWKGATSPESFLETCLQDKIRESEKIILKQGGYINNENSPTKDFLFEGESTATKVSYLCYSGENYFQCVNQEPLLFQHIEDEIKDYISDDVRDCFEDLKDSLRKQGYQITNDEYNNFDVQIKSDRISVDINAEITMTKADDTSNYKNFKVETASKIYELILVVQEAVNKEAADCDFNYVGYMLLYPKFEIEQFLTRDSSKIYSVRLKGSDEEFRFAVRGCVTPPGWVE